MQNFESEIFKHFKLVNGHVKYSFPDIPRHFDLKSKHPDFVFGKSFVIGRGEAALKLQYVSTQSLHKLPNPWGSYATWEFLGVYSFMAFPCSIDFGRTLIRSETVSDKVAELFNSIEVDLLEFPEFSSRYYCLSDEEAKFRAVMNDDIVKLFLNYKLDLVIEFYRNVCLIRPNVSIIEEKIMLYQIQFAFELQKMIGKKYRI
jgi:hypothetical protein